MSGTLYLITEDENDYRIVEAGLKALGISKRVKWSKSSKPKGVSRLADELKLLIRTALAEKSAGDCIVVLHDADTHVQPDRTIYNRIRQICEQYEKDVLLVIAHDEIEAWLLADGGVCAWLDVPPRNRDGIRKPSEEFERLLKNKHRLKYQGADRRKVYDHINGDNAGNSPSLRAALELLENAPCRRSD